MFTHIYATTTTSTTTTTTTTSSSKIDLLKIVQALFLKNVKILDYHIFNFLVPSFLDISLEEHVKKE